MPTAVEQLNYHELLKDEGKTVKVWLPRTVAKGDLDTFRDDIIQAVKEEDKDWSGEPLTVVGEMGKYTQTDRWGYRSVWKDFYVVSYERLYTFDEIEKAGKTIYNGVLKRRKAAEKKRTANIKKLHQLQRDLGLPLTEEV